MLEHRSERRKCYGPDPRLADRISTAGGSLAGIVIVCAGCEVVFSGASAFPATPVGASRTTVSSIEIPHHAPQRPGCPELRWLRIHWRRRPQSHTSRTSPEKD